MSMTCMVLNKTRMRAGINWVSCSCDAVTACCGGVGNELTPVKVGQQGQRGQKQYPVKSRERPSGVL